MGRKYPEVDSRRKITGFRCEVCKNQCEVGERIEWRVSWFVGDNEFENICLDCLALRKEEEEEKDRKHQLWLKRNKKRLDAEEEKYRKSRLKMQIKREQECITAISKIANHFAEMGYETKIFTPYQMRIGGQIDIYPDSYPKRYFHLKTRKWGDYQNEKHLLNKYSISPTLPPKQTN